MSKPRGAAWGGPGDVFGALVGEWRFDRVVTGIAEMTGTARFIKRADGGLDYLEAAQLRLASGRELAASRAYVWRAHPRGFDVCFAEPALALFQAVRLRSAGADLLSNPAPHLCAADHYLGHYAFLADGSFVIEQQVEGPAKHHAITTRFRRADS